MIIIKGAIKDKLVELEGFSMSEEEKKKKEEERKKLQEEEEKIKKIKWDEVDWDEDME